MQNFQEKTSDLRAAQAFGDADFRALTSTTGRYPGKILLRAIAKLFVQNDSPSIWEIEQFQELMLNLIPSTDIATRNELSLLLAPYVHTPTGVLEALEQNVTAEEPIQVNLEKNQSPILGRHRQPVYPIAQLKELLPLQISRKMALVAARASRRGDRYILRSILSSHLSVSRSFMDCLLTHHDGLFLATALRALRMPHEAARTILLSREGLESRDLIYIPQMISSFERLNPEACRKRLKDWEKAFSLGGGHKALGVSAEKHLPQFVQSDVVTQSSQTRGATGRLTTSGRSQVG